MTYTIEPIATIKTPFSSKFGIPRQANLAPAAKGVISMLPPYNQTQALSGLKQTSHIWVLFLFHQSITDKPVFTVRPPRLGGNKRLGVFATRSPQRPNNIGQSLLKVENIVGTDIHVSGVDLLNNTPIIDIKPYIHYADSRSDSINSMAATEPKTIIVSWQASALKQALSHSQRLETDISQLIEQSLAQNPKPAYHPFDAERIYGLHFWDLDIQFKYLNENHIEIVTITSFKNNKMS